MKHINIVNLLAYREQIAMQYAQPSIPKITYSDDLADAIQHLIKRLRDCDPIEKAIG